jgi:CDP-4-dehydro-6-deoxyglucose reductase/3-phenylpropionate/trans-cinnamate dioxygenase ferredoxin reductase subunit
VCTTCAARLTEGTVRLPGRGLLAGPADEVLLCRAVPRSALTIAPTGIERREPPTRRTMTTTVHKITYPAPGVAVLALRYPIGKWVKFQAGQYLTVHLPDGDTRNYSMANPPHRNDAVSLHIRTHPGGRFSEQTLTTLRRGDPLVVTLPYGEWTPAPGIGPILLTVTGTGFAPAKSIIEEHIYRRAQRPLHLYWGARRAEDLYLADLPARWASRYPWFRYTPVLSAPHNGWTGQVGHVQQAVLADYPDLSDHDVYACGNPAMTQQARIELTSAAGLPETRFHSDAFVSSTPDDQVEAVAAGVTG